MANRCGSREFCEQFADRVAIFFLLPILLFFVSCLGQVSALILKLNLTKHTFFSRNCGVYHNSEHKHFSNSNPFSMIDGKFRLIFCPTRNEVRQQSPFSVLRALLSSPPYPPRTLFFLKKRTRPKGYMVWCCTQTRRGGVLGDGWKNSGG